MRLVRLADLSDEERRKALEEQQERLNKNRQESQNIQNEANQKFNDYVSQYGAYDTNKHTTTIGDLRKAYRNTPSNNNIKTSTSGVYRNSIWNDVKNTFNNLMVNEKQRNNTYNRTSQSMEQQALEQNNNANFIMQMQNVNKAYKQDQENRLRNSIAYKQLDKFNTTSDYGIGNIDLNNRPVYKNEDGSISTVRSMSFWDDDEQKEILVPTIAFDKNGKAISLTNDEAIDRYYETGEYLGKFDDYKEADKYAEELHEQQDKLYSNNYEKAKLNNIKSEKKLLEIAQNENDKLSNNLLKDISSKNSVERTKELKNISRSQSSPLFYDDNKFREINNSVLQYKTAEEAQEEANKINEDLKGGKIGSSVGHVLEALPAKTMEAVSSPIYATGSLMNLKLPTGTADQDLKDWKTISSKYDQTTGNIESGLVRSASNVSGTIGYMIPSILASAIAPETNLGRITQGASVGGQSYIETLNDDASNKLQSALTGLGKGTASYAIEGIAGGNILGKGSLDDLAVKTIASKTSNEASKKIASMVYEVGGEVFEEELENQVDYLVDKIVNDKGISLKEWLTEQNETVKSTIASTLVLKLLGLGGNTYKDVKEYEYNADAKKWINEAEKIIKKENLQFDIDKLKENNNQAQNIINNNQNLQQNTTQNQFNSQKQQIIPLQDKNTSESNIGENTTKIKGYHGTNENFDNFDLKYFGKHDQGDFGKAVYFSDNENTASKYGKNVKQQEIELNNPYVINTEEDYKQLWSQLAKETDISKLDKTELKLLKDPYTSQEEKNFMLYDKLNSEEKANAIQKLGYDGVIDNTYGQIAVFNTDKINNIANNQEILYNNAKESESGYNESIQLGGMLESNRELPRVYEEAQQQKQYTRTEYEKWEKSIKPIEYNELTSAEQKISNDIQGQYNKVLSFFDGNENDLYYGGASYSDKNKIYIDRNQAKNFGTENMVYHETLESDILHNNDLSKDVIKPSIQKIIEDPNFEKQKQEFWKSETGKIPSDYLIAKDILCDRFSELKTGKKVDYNNVLSQETNMTIDFSLENFHKELYGKEIKISKDSSFNLPTKEDLKTNVKFNNDNLIQESKNITDDDIAKILTENSPNVSEKRKFGAFLKANLIDKGMVFEELSRKTNNRELQGKYDYTLTSEARGQNAIGNARYDYQTISENGKIKKGEKNAKQISKSLTDIIDEVGENPTDFYNYMYHQLNIDRMTLEDRFGGDTGINYERKNTIKNKPVFGEKVTAEISKEKVQELEKKHPEFKEYAKDVYDYLDANTNELVRNGVISKETQQLFKEMYPHYVPISRVKDNGSAISVPLDTGRTGINNPIKRAKGGNSDIKPLFQTMADRTLQTYRASARNSFGIELKNTLEKAKQLNQLKEFADMDFIMENMTDEEQNSTLLQEGKNGRNPTFTVFENGEKVTFDISKDMYDALKPKNELLKRIDDSKLSKILNKVNNFRRGLLTEYNPVFCLTNSMKDIQDVLGNSQHSMKTYSKIPESTAQIVSKGYWYKEYIQNGGEQNSYFKDGEFDKVKNNVPTVAKKIFTFPLKTISKVNNVIEMTPRLAEYIVSREQGKSIETSMLDASRVTTNFKAGGDFTKTLNRNGFTFLNASVQGMQQQIRNIQEANAKGLKGWAVLATKYAIAGLPILLLNNLFWKDDDDYKDLQDYAKDNYYIIGKTQNGTFIRIPKGRAVATVQKIVSNANDFIKDVNDKKIIDIDKFGKQFWEDLKEDISFAYDNLAPNNPMDNNIIAPIIQAITNKSWYGEDIVSSNLQDKPTKEQYDESTDKLSIWIGNKTGISPKKINYLLDQYSGGVGDVLLPMMTPQAENNVLEDKFTVNSVMKSKYPGEFFNKLDELKVNSNSSNASDEDIVKYKYINGISSDINKLYSQKRDIQNSNFSDDEKKKRLHEVQLKINELSKNCLSKIDEISTGKIYAQIDNSQYYKDIKGNWNELSDEEKEKNKTYNISLESYSDYKYKTGELKQEKLDNGELEEKEQLKDKDKIQILVDSNYSENEKENIYKNYINSKDKKTILVDKLGLPINEYLKYKSQIFENDKDEDGETISGSKKEKVYSYLNSVSDEDLSQDYKKIICKIEDINDYDNDIVNFINNSKNLNYSERTEILKNIGFKIDKDGKIQTKSILPIYKYVK